MKNFLTKRPTSPTQRAKSAFSPLPFSVLVALLTTFWLSSCTDHTLPPPSAPVPGAGIQPTGPKPDYAPDIDNQMQAVIEEFQRLNPTPLYLLMPQEARMRPTIKDAVMSLLAKNNITLPPPNVTITQRSIPGADGVPIRVVIYTPKNATGPFPVIEFLHGGGWVIASPEVYEASSVALAQNTGSVVVSVDYRLAPENKFPTAHRDSYAAYKWIRNNMSALNGNGKVAVAGESAGGNMAVTVSMMARDSSLTLPVHILSVYPVANNDLNTPSYIKYANAVPLSRPLVMWFVDKYFRSPADGDSPLISLVDVANLSGLPPTTIIGAEIDPLQTEGMQLRDKLQSQGVMVTYKLFQGVTHEFFGTYAIVPKAQQAQDLAAMQLRNAFK